MNPKQSGRRKFLQFGFLSVFSGLFIRLPTFGRNGNDSVKGIIVHEHEGEHILTGRRQAPMNLKISRQVHGVENISFCTEDIIPGRKLRIHKHLYHDELIFIHSGEGKFTLDQDIVNVKKGAVIFIPRGMWHGLENTGNENILMVFQYSPAGFEGYFRENGTAAGIKAKERTAEEYAAAEIKYGMVYQ